MIRPRIKDVPNILSALRLLAAPFACFLIIAGHDTAALLVFAAAGASDGLDGFIARRWGVTSDFGAWLDPVADKLLMLLSFSALFIVSVTPLWLVALVVARDVAIVLGWLLVKLFASPMATSPLFVGKVSTLIQLLYVLGVLLVQAFDIQAPRLVQAAAWICGLVTILSMASYGSNFLRGYFQGRRTA
ncbi:MAG TPA: CDP-alcohol phosphatidyltransferase family protein [Rhizomicrobium sp.]|jgi:cardiolipin synthase|nr:CDP-alcohol phosphatidyltransferase family protein [Rhizomicrobium sp.]